MSFQPTAQDGERHLFRTAVFVIVRNEHDEILLLERAGTEFLPGYYDFPSGHVEVGESFQKAAIRELAEETTLVASETDLELVHISQNNLDFPYINIVYELRTWQGTPNIGEPHKCTDIQFFNTNDLPQKLTLSVRLLQAQKFSRGFEPLYIDTKDFKRIMGEDFKLV